MKNGKHLWQYTSTDGTSMECIECGLAINYNDGNFFELLDSDCPEIVMDGLAATYRSGCNPNHVYCGECVENTCLGRSSNDKNRNS